MTLGLFCLSEHYGNDLNHSLVSQLDLIEYADLLGFDEVWFAEHHFNPFSVIPDPSSLIAFAAARTKRIRLGTAGYLAPFYHPVRLAESIAVLDHLSGGRINAGFAKGGFAPDTRHFLQSKEELRDLMFETVECVDRLLHGRNVTCKGRFVQTDGTTIAPPPVQYPVPFYIATFSSRETIEFAAQHGYGLMMSQGATLNECIEAQNLYRSIAGYDPQMVVLRVFYLADSYEEAALNAIPGIDHFVKCMRAVQAEQTQPTFDLENYRKLLEQRTAFFDGQKFFDNAVLGSPEDCARILQTLNEEITHLHLALKPASFDPALNAKMLERFVNDVIPQLHLKENE
ncbi:MAG: LLM class flavin-dependent oxidoreductase [Sulfuricurvum sp.]